MVLSFSPFPFSFFPLFFLVCYKRELSCTPNAHTHTQQSKSNEMLSGLRYFEHALKDNGRGQPKPSFSWGAVDMASVARCFIELCSKAVDVLSSEPRLLDVTSPTYVLGECFAQTF